MLNVYDKGRAVKNPLLSFYIRTTKGSDVPKKTKRK